MSRIQPFPYTLNPDEIPTKKVWAVASDHPHCDYACPDSCWEEHHKAWCKEWRNGNHSAPQPMPYGHCTFDKPLAYACVPYGCTDKSIIRKAWEHKVRANLHGWDRDLTPDQLTAIVNATVEARMQGESLGGAPYLACIMASI